MATRSSLAGEILRRVSSDRLRLIDAASGWPARVEFRRPNETVQLALFVGPLGDAGRKARRHIERRYQNPGKDKPIVVPDGAVPLLVGSWTKDDRTKCVNPVLAINEDIQRRVGRRTRFSVFTRVATLKHAAATGWAEGANADGETVTCFHPAALPAYLDLMLDGIRPSPAPLAQIVSSSGVLEQDEPPARARVTRQTEAYVRSASFGRRVLDAYDGLCAMCGLNLGLVQGAHIYPVSAPNSPDTTDNGLALCANHHVAFDRCEVFIEPNSLELRLAPHLNARAANPVSQAFLVGTARQLTLPKQSSDRPNPEWIARRIAHFGEKYAWAD